MIPLELRYVGKGEDGLHEWVNVNQVWVSSTFVLAGDLLPAKTTITLNVVQ